jgi:hypothetical protein
MKLIHQAVVKGFMFCVPDHLHPDRPQLFKGAADGSLVRMNNCGGPADIFGGVLGRRGKPVTLFCHFFGGWALHYLNLSRHPSLTHQ